MTPDRATRVGGRFHILWIAVIYCVMVVSGCGEWPRYGRQTPPEIAREAGTSTTPNERLKTDDPDKPIETQSPQKIVGTGRTVGRTLSRRAAIDANDPNALVLNFKDAELVDVVKVILGETLKENYLIEPGVSGTVSIESHRGFKHDELLSLLESLLAIHNAVLLREPSGLIRVLPRDRAASGSLGPLESLNRGALVAGYRSQLFVPRFVAVAELKKLLEPYVGNHVTLTSDEKRNVLIAAGTGTDLAKLRDAIAVFDVDWLAGMSVGLFPVSYSEVKTVMTDLKTVFSANTKDDMSDIVRFTPIERLNAILVVTPQARYLDDVEAWIERLDQAGATDERRLFVYRVENGKATEMAAVLSEIFSSRRERRVPLPQLAPGLEPVELRSPGLAPSVPTAPDQAGLAVTGSGEIRIIADEPNNALLLLATPREYRMVTAALRELDVTPLQVLIEASIIEVSLTEDLEYGVEWFFKNNLNVGGAERTGNALLDLGDGGLAALTPGFSYALTDSASRVRAVLNLLAAESELNVLSSPSLMVLSNQSAIINVGDEVPIPTRQAVSTIDPDAPTVNEIEYRDTGVILEVTPRVNSGGLVTMEVAQEVSDVGQTTTSGIDAPTFQQRKIASTVAVQSGNTVVLGGLIRDRTSTGESGIPGLYRLPVVGKLFGATTNEARRTELLVLITPRAVVDAAAATALTEEFRAKLRGLATP